MKRYYLLITAAVLILCFWSYPQAFPPTPPAAPERNASDSAAGIVELATDAETITGSATDRATTPANVAAVLKTVQAFGLDQNVQTLSGAKTLVITDKPVQKLDPDGSDRDVNLPSEASSTDLIFLIWNQANGAGEDLVIKDDTPSTLATIAPENIALCSCDGTTWTVRIMLPPDSLSVDGVSGAVTMGTTGVNPARVTSKLSLTTDTVITAAQILANYWITNQGAAGEIDNSLPAVSYPISVCVVDEEAEVQETAPPTGEAFDLDGVTLDANDCIDSPGVVGSKMVCSRIQNAAGTWLWSCDTVRGAFVDTGASD